MIWDVVRGAHFRAVSKEYWSLVIFIAFSNARGRMETQLFLGLQPSFWLASALRTTLNNDKGLRFLSNIIY